MVDENNRTQKRDGFLSGVLVLSLSAIIVKIIGLVYKIPMLRLLGSEGMGYFNSAYEIYTLFCTVATTGLPVAMSVMISSGKNGSPRAVFRAALRLFLALGVVGCGIMIAFAKPFAAFLGSEGAAWCILAISPTVLLICLSGAFRGYFQGKSKMLPTAVSQVLEALGKLVLGLLFARVALDAGFSTEIVAAFAVMGLTLGTAVSVLYLALTKSFGKLTEPELLIPQNERGITFALLKMAIPITLSSAVVSITKVIDMSMILRRLQDLGQSGEEAFSAYGSYTTLAVPLFSLAPALVSSVAMPLIPALSKAVSARDAQEQTKTVGKAIKITTLISMPTSLGLIMFAKPILNLLFSGEHEAISVASPLLAILGLSVNLSCLITVGNAVLQAYGRVTVPIVSMTVGSLVKIALAYFLIGRMGIVGAPISTFFCDLAINAVNFYFICREMPQMPSFDKTIIRPAVSAAVSVSLARLIYNFIVIYSGEKALTTLVSIAFAAGIYLVTGIIFGAVDKEELAEVPIFGKLSYIKKKKDI